MADGPSGDADLDVVLVGAGIMSATLGSLLHQVAPDLRIVALERLADAALESTDAMNNAGTGHAAYCELNYTPEQTDGSISISKAVTINESFETTLVYWSHLVQQGFLPYPSRFMSVVPHMSFVWGEGNAAFLRKRHSALVAHPYFADMQYSEDREQLVEWMPLVMDGRDPDQTVAATYVARGTDVDFGAVTRHVFDHLAKRAEFRLHLRHQVTSVRREPDGRWRVTAKDLSTGDHRDFRTRFVFLGAGGGALPLLGKSGIAEGRGYGGFPVSGQWLVCKNEAVVARHETKVYGKASVGAPPMSVPHLDTRLIDGRRSLLFGPFAGFSTKFLKTGSYLDLPLSVNPGNVVPMLAAGAHNVDLTRYLIGQVLQSQDDRIAALTDFLPTARKEDWELAIAGQRVQIIKKDPRERGKLEFGTEVVAAADGSLAALLGASPGASTAVPTMVGLIERCFADRVARPDAQATLRRIFPSYGRSMASDPSLLATVRGRVQEVLGIPT